MRVAILPGTHLIDRAYAYRQSRRMGAHTVEMAIALPILFLTVFACIEFFRVSMLKQYAENVSYEAARHVIVPGGTASEATAAANKMLNYLGISGATIQITPDVIDDSTTEVTVRVTIPHKQNQWITPFFTGSLNATSETTLLTERVPNIQISVAAGGGPPPPPPPAGQAASTGIRCPCCP
jgi:Flp pilus assembly protein TadG